ncbi:MAG: hypothetical protein AAF725_23930, partial [Acidobacteriota bacterium]
AAMNAAHRFLKMSRGLAGATGLLLLLGLSAPAAWAGGDEIFSDDFESGFTSAWTTVAGAPEVTAYGLRDLDLRDPHFFVEAVLCFDVTDNDLPFGQGPGFNTALEEALNGDEDQDGFLDNSTLLLFRPFVDGAVGERVDLVSGTCTAPVATTSCTPALPPAILDYSEQLAGPCTQTEPGTTSNYVLGVTEPAAPCFGAGPQDLSLALGDIEIVLRDVEIGATFSGGGVPPTALVSGLLKGFLLESDADATQLPATLPVIGGLPLSVLLPGGTGSCAVGDDRDMHDGESGWWFYLNYVAEPVPAYSE